MRGLVVPLGAARRHRGGREHLRRQAGHHALNRAADHELEDEARLRLAGLEDDVERRARGRTQRGRERVAPGAQVIETGFTC